MTSRDVLRLHIGLPKTGSTSLQRALASSTSVTFLGKGEASHFADDALHQLVRKIAPYRQPTADEADRVRRALARAWVSGPAILSDEVLSGIGFSTMGRGQDVVEVVRAIAATVDAPVEVLLVVREPTALLGSYHSQMIYQGSDLGLSGLLALILLRPDSWIARSLDPATWVDALPVRGVRVLPFERLFGDPACSEELFAWLGAPDVHASFLALHKNRRKTDEVLLARLSATREPGARSEGWRQAFSDPMVRDAAARAGVEPERIRAALEPVGAAGDTGDPLRPDPILLAAVERHLRACNTRLAQRLPEHDWAGMGYRLEDAASG